MADQKPHGRQAAPTNPGGARVIGLGRQAADTKSSPAGADDATPAPRAPRRHQAASSANRKEG